MRKKIPLAKSVTLFFRVRNTCTVGTTAYFFVDEVFQEPKSIQSLKREDEMQSVDNNYNQAYHRENDLQAANTSRDGYQEHNGFPGVFVAEADPVNNLQKNQPQFHHAGIGHNPDILEALPAASPAELATPRILVLCDDFNSRSTLRDFLQKSVPDDVINYILECGRLSASGGNEQPWKFGVITDVAVISKIAESASVTYSQKWIKSSPLLIVLCTQIFCNFATRV